MTVESISLATNVTSEGIFLILTWISTYGIARDCSRLGIRSPLTTLLLRDGELSALYGLSVVDRELQARYTSCEYGASWLGHATPPNMI